jgi:hypothetical protein
MGSSDEVGIRWYEFDTANCKPTRSVALSPTEGPFLRRVALLVNLQSEIYNLECCCGWQGRRRLRVSPAEISVVPRSFRAGAGFRPPRLDCYQLSAD